MKIKNQKPVIIDVRSPAEFRNGHVAGSINIPLQDIPLQLEVIKTMNQPILLCCASGNRSGQAVAYLRKQGVTCDNGGSWIEINQPV